MAPFTFDLDPALLLARGNDLLEIVDALEREFDGAAMSWVVLDRWDDYEEFWVRTKPGADVAAADALEARLKRGPVPMTSADMRSFASSVAQTIWGAFVFVLDAGDRAPEAATLSFGAFDAEVWEFECDDRALHDRASRALEAFRGVT